MFGYLTGMFELHSGEKCCVAHVSTFIRMVRFEAVPCDVILGKEVLVQGYRSWTLINTVRCSDTVTAINCPGNLWTEKEIIHCILRSMTFLWLRTKGHCWLNELNVALFNMITSNLDQSFKWPQWNVQLALIVTHMWHFTHRDTLCNG